MSRGGIQEAGTGAFAFTSENAERARTYISRYPVGRQASAVIPLLDLAQRQNDGWVSLEVMDNVAELLDMPPVRVYEVATFYTPNSPFGASTGA